nr:nuclear transport factor 2 family protein [Acetobacter persici]
MKAIVTLAIIVLSAYGFLAKAQDAVVPAENVEALFTSNDSQLHANKQVVYHIIRDLLEAGHWDKAGQYISEDYVQHNPNAKSGLAPVVDFFTNVLKVQPRPIPDKISLPIIAVTAEGDLVTVLYRRTVEDSKHPQGRYTTTWYDTWQIKGGKAVRHWDPALLGESSNLR